MRVYNLTATLLSVAVAAALLVACETDEQEAQKFPRADDGIAVEVSRSELVTYQLANGLTVFLQEHHGDERVAIEVVYRAGFNAEPAGQVQVSHIAEHATVFSATETLEPREGVEKIQKHGLVNAEAVGHYVHFDYITDGAYLDEILQMEAERLTTVRFDDKTLEQQAERAAGEIASVLKSDRGTLMKFAFMALMQAVNHGQKDVPVTAANYQRTVEEVTRFHAERYRVNDMIIAVVGNLEIEKAKAMIEKHFGSIAPKPEPASYRPSVERGVTVRWDIDGSVLYFVYPGPYESYKDRLILAMFGSYLNQFLTYNPEIPTLARSTYVSNPSYPVGPMPFFVFAQPAPYKSLSDVRERVAGLMAQAVESVDEKMFVRMKTSIGSFVEASFLESAESTYKIDRKLVIGQHALNLCIKHMFKEGRTDEEFAAILETVTLEDTKSTLSKYLSDDRRVPVLIIGG